MLDRRRLRMLDEDLGEVVGPLRADVPVGPLTTYRVGGNAARFLEVHDADQLARVARALARRVRPSGDDVLVLGRGSNLLVADAGIASLVIALGEGFETFEVREAGAGSGPGGGSGPGDDSGPGDGGNAVVVAGGALSLPVLARRSVAAGLTGLEWTVGVPGSVGGAVRMNAGGHGSDVAESLLRVRLIDLHRGEDVVMEAAQLELGYRRSAVRPEQVVVSAEFSARRDPHGSGNELISEIVRWRRENQPGGQNAGSVFTNPPGDSAGRLIDAAGCKGLRIGTAEVSPKHANFIQADPDGSADDVAAVMHEVIERVEARFGIRLHPETVMVGFGDPPDDRPDTRLNNVHRDGADD